MFVNFFINRPIFATVLALIIILAGAVCIPFLPMAQFPDIAPPVVQVTTQYVGADAEVVEKTVTSPIEEQVNGVEGMTYMNSYSSSDGTSIINVTFDIGYDLDIAAVDTQNYTEMAMPQMPDDVRRYGVTVKKQATDFIFVINLLSPDGTYDDLFLSNYASINVVDELKRIFGVGNVTIFGERKYSMRFWLDPDKLASMDLTSDDVISAIREQNLQVAAGSIGTPPSPETQKFQYKIITKGRLETPQEFEDIVIRTAENGAVVRLKDVGRVELGAENYNSFSAFNSRGSASIGIFQLPGANAIDIANQARATIKRLATRFPKGMTYTIGYDATMFVRESIKEVLKTLFEAILLVFLVIFIFLQNWRTTLIPAITIPVSLVGTFAIMAAFGFSINTLTLFGLVLAIGLVVDDSIVVVENVTRILSEENLKPSDATKKAMTEVVGPIVATTLVLMAVFVPVSFIPGLSGQLYKQFALTIAFSVGISAINALSLSPAMCAVFLHREAESRNWLFSKFNRGFSKFSEIYKKATEFFIKNGKFVILSFLAMLCVTGLLFHQVPTGFIPEEDQGYFYLFLQGPEGMSLERTQGVTKKVEKILLDTKGIQNVITIGGYNIVNATIDPRVASIVIILTPWKERKTIELAATGIMRTIAIKMRSLPDMIATPFNPPPIRGLSSTGGIRLELEDYEQGNLEDLYSVTNRFVTEASQRPELMRVSNSFNINYPQFYLELDRTKAKTLGLSLTSIFNTLQAQLGSLYVNDFNKFGRVYRAYLQADKDFRSDKQDISRLYVRSNKNEMIPLSSILTIKEKRGPQTIAHYNLYRTVEIDATPAPGYSSDQAMKAMEDVASQTLPEGYGVDWTGTALQELKSSGLAKYIFALALAFVFLFLAAQYESWSMPFMVLFAVPLAILGALAAQWLRGLVNDVYCQIGLVMLIGLASKNAILIVEFAKAKREKEGMPIVEAAMTAARIRLRPILMTALAFIMGVLPLVVASGAGAASRHSLGTAVFGGMIASTVLSLGIVPVLYVIIENIRETGLAKIVMSKKWRQAVKLPIKKPTHN